MAVVIFFPGPQCLRDWFDANACDASALLVGFHKVATGRSCMSWSQGVDEALCVGWIDGVRRRIDDATYSVRFTPRKPSSIWSAVNIEKFERLVAEGRMTAKGIEAFAKRTEARSRVYAHEQTSLPQLSLDELELFRSSPTAWSYFASTPPGYKRNALHWVCAAKKHATRRARLGKLIDLSAAGLRL